jgi:hypothetical protein
VFLGLGKFAHGFSDSFPTWTLQCSPKNLGCSPSKGSRLASKGACVRAQIPKPSQWSFQALTVNEARPLGTDLSLQEERLLVCVAPRPEDLGSWLVVGIWDYVYTLGGGEGVQTAERPAHPYQGPCCCRALAFSKSSADIVLMFQDQDPSWIFLVCLIVLVQKHTELYAPFPSRFLQYIDMHSEYRSTCWATCVKAMDEDLKAVLKKAGQ